MRRRKTVTRGQHSLRPKPSDLGLFCCVLNSGKMAFASRVHRLLAGSSSSLQSSSNSLFTRFFTSLTTPKLFISGLSRLTTDDSLRNAFAPHGQLVEAKVIVDREMGRSKGFGFVTYETIEEAEKAREAMNAKMLDGWVIFVDPAKPKGPRSPPGSYAQATQPNDSGLTINKTVGWCG